MRRRAEYVDLRAWGLFVTILGALLGVPLWVVLMQGRLENLWTCVPMFVIGVAGAVGLWRWLSGPVDPRSDEKQIPAMREAKLWEERRRRSKEVE